MKPHFETLRLIRQITEDGVVTDDEVMSLGNFLNNNNTARKSWPGNVIFEVLKRVFDDARLDPHELKSLAYILRGIELQCCGTLGEAPNQKPNDGLPDKIEFEEVKFALPMLDMQLQVAASGDGGKLSEVDLAKHECSCGDWTHKRFSFPEDSPGRACRCIVVAMRDPEIESEIPRLQWNRMLFQLLDLFTECGHTFDAVPTWKLLRHDNREWLVSWGDREWANVYTENQNGRVERYCYHMYDGRWAYGAKPIGATAVTHYFAGDSDVGGNTTIPGF